MPHLYHLLNAAGTTAILPIALFMWVAHLIDPSCVPRPQHNRDKRVGFLEFVGEDVDTKKRKP